tara:strand:- start:118 stop:1323 length:1206 start_codon:yes stop_codon:yes gene_type:complete
MRIYAAIKKIFEPLIFFYILNTALFGIEQGNALRTTYEFSQWPSELAPRLEGSFHKSQWNLRNWWKDSAEFHDWSWEIAIETVGKYQSRAAESLDNNLESPLRLLDLHAQLNNTSNSQNSISIDRMWYHWRHSQFDVTIGRQAIGLGTSHFISVLDIMAPFAPGTLDSTYKPGVDAIRIQSAYGDSGERDFIFAFSQQDSAHSFLYRQRVLKGNYDFESMIGRVYERNFVGFGFEGSRGKVGQWGEIALFGRKKNETLRTGSKHFAFSAVVGLEYFLSDSREWGISYFHQDFGASSSLERLTLSMEPIASQGWLTLSGRNYAHLRYSHLLRPLVRANFNTLINLQDQSRFYQPRVDINVRENLNFSLFAWISEGKTGPNPLDSSEFGSMASGVGMFLQYYF